MEIKICGSARARVLSVGMAPRITEDGVAESLRHKPILSLKKDRDSNLWVGADSGLFRVDSRGVSSQDKAGGMPVTALFEDREGNLWTGDTQGIERFRDNAFVSYSAPNVSHSDGNGPIYADGENRTWFAPPDAGLIQAPRWRIRTNWDRRYGSRQVI